MRKPLFGLLLASAVGLVAMPALAADRHHGRDHDRPPTPHERAAITKVLRTHGYVSWKKIELDDGRWEVDDARTRQGRKYDLKLDPRTLRIVERERDR